MPIYEYECKKCGHQFEIMQKMSDAPKTDCPACGEPALTKLISAAAFRLKGGGWYETDFKSKKQKNLDGGAENKPASDKTPSDSKGSDKTASGASKPDTAASKTETKPTPKAD
jgi:putative FmdB family regulatory protein